MNVKHLPYNQPILGFVCAKIGRAKLSTIYFPIFSVFKPYLFHIGISAWYSEHTMVFLQFIFYDHIVTDESGLVA
jgi:hypothetical protein